MRVPSGSAEPVLENVTASGALPVEIEAATLATGGRLVFAVTAVMAEPVRPVASVTVRVAVNVPAVV